MDETNKFPETKNVTFLKERIVNTNWSLSFIELGLDDEEAIPNDP